MKGKNISIHVGQLEKLLFFYFFYKIAISSGGLLRNSNKTVTWNSVLHYMEFLKKIKNWSIVNRHLKWRFYCCTKTKLLLSFLIFSPSFVLLLLPWRSKKKNFYTSHLLHIQISFHFTKSINYIAIFSFITCSLSSSFKVWI